MSIHAVVPFEGSLERSQNNLTFFFFFLLGNKRLALETPKSDESSTHEALIYLGRTLELGLLPRQSPTTLDLVRFCDTNWALN